MTEVSFYHLQRTGLETALPKLLEKALDRGLRAVVVAGSDDRVAVLDNALWTYGQGTFLPHGTAADAFRDRQPVYLTTEPADRPNGATVLVLVDSVGSEEMAGMERVLHVFDGRDPEAVTLAKERWRSLAAQGHTLTYWQQTEAGGWEKKG